MKEITKLIILSMCMSAMSNATESASPSLNSNCRLSVATPPNGNNVIFDESCRIAYVMPPRKGIAEIESLARNTNLQFCPAVKSVGQTASRTFNSMNILSQKLEQMIQGFEPLDQDLIAKRIELAQAKAKMEMAKKELEKANVHIEELRQTIRDARKAHENCVEENSINHTLCVELKIVWDEAKSRVSDFRTGEYKEKSDQASDAAEDYELKAAHNIIHYLIATKKQFHQ